MMKNMRLIPLTLLTLTALSGCGGEGGNIYVDNNNNSGVTPSTSCAATSSTCLSFNLNYPVAGLNFTCSSDTVNKFITQKNSNAVEGACKLGDTVNFSIKGQGTDKSIELGSVNLKSISPLKISSVPISLIDIATAMVGQAPKSLSPNDETIQVAMALAKIFQAASLKEGNLVGDVQPIELTESLKKDLSLISQTVTVADFKSGSYANILKPWLDVSAITDDQAFAVVTQLINQQAAGTYQSDFLPWPIESSDGVQKYIEGFHGKSVQGNEIIANMYLLTDRTNHTLGYGLQWQGKPNDKTSQGTVITDGLNRITLLSKVAPEKMNAYAQTNWIDPLTKSISAQKPFQFDLTTTNSTLLIKQGRLLNTYVVAGTEAVYKAIMGINGNSDDYGKWSQTTSTETFDGSLDATKSNPVSYLDNRIFTTQNNTKAGNYYLFPMYANIVFNFEDSSVAPVTLGIRIDENGDIISNIGPNATENDLSGTCPTLNSNLVDSNGVQQYRIGTTGAALYSTNDKSLTIRMILAHPVFKKLDGVILGLNQNLTVSNDSGTGGAYSAGGVKINLHNLLTDHNTSRGINITDYGNNQAVWVNIHAAYQKVYNNLKDVNPKPTDDQVNLAKRTNGTLTQSIVLPSCYKPLLKQ